MPGCLISCIKSCAWPGYYEFRKELWHKDHLCMALEQGLARIIDVHDERRDATLLDLSLEVWPS